MGGGENDYPGRQTRERDPHTWLLEMQAAAAVSRQRHGSSISCGVLFHESTDYSGSRNACYMASHAFSYLSSRCLGCLTKWSTKCSPQVGCTNHGSSRKTRHVRLEGPSHSKRYRRDGNHDFTLKIHWEDPCHGTRCRFASVVRASGEGCLPPAGVASSHQPRSQARRHYTDPPQALEEAKVAQGTNQEHVNSQAFSHPNTSTPIWPSRR